MQYSLEKISTVEQCNELLARAQRKSRTLYRQRRNLGESIDMFRARMNRLEKELADVHASLAALTPAYHAMPEGKEKATLIIMIKRLELRQARLQKQAYTCNAAYLLVKELRYNRLDSQVSAMNDYVDALERVQTALSQPAMRVLSRNDFSNTPADQEGLQISLASPQLPDTGNLDFKALHGALTGGDEERGEASYSRVERVAS